MQGREGSWKAAGLSICDPVPAHRELQVLELRHRRQVQQALHRQVLDVAQHEPRQRCARGFRVRVQLVVLSLV